MFSVCVRVVCLVTPGDPEDFLPWAHSTWTLPGTPSLAVATSAGPALHGVPISLENTNYIPLIYTDILKAVLKMKPGTLNN